MELFGREVVKPALAALTLFRSSFLAILNCLKRRRSLFVLEYYSPCRFHSLFIKHICLPLIRHNFLNIIN